MRSIRGRERCEIFAQYVIETGATVRRVANKFGISKSTVHKDLTHRLYYVNRRLFLDVKDILDKNKAERHIRGGEATRQKYMQKQSRREA